MDKIVAYSVLLFLFFGSVEVADACQVDAQLFDKCESPGDNLSMCFYCNQRCLGFSYQHIIFSENGFCHGMNTAERYLPMLNLINDSSQETPKWDWAIVHLPTNISNGLSEDGLSDISASSSLFWRHFNEYGISDITMWLLFDDLRLTMSTQVTDDRTSDPSAPFPVSVLLISSVLIGLIGFRRTVVDS